MGREPLFQGKLLQTLIIPAQDLLFAQLDPQLVEGSASVFAAPLVPLTWLNDLLREAAACFLAEDPEGLYQGGGLRNGCSLVGG